MDPMSFTGSPSDLVGGAASGGYVDPFQGMAVKESDSGYTSAIPETSALREWEEKHEQQLEEKACEEQAQKNAKREAAAAEIAKWNEERKANTSKKHATNRADEETFAAANKNSPQGATPWERIVDLIDTSAHATDGDNRDVSRMRNLLIQLKSNPPAT